MWLYANIKRKESLKDDLDRDRMRLICTFINPKAAQDIFKDTKETVSDGFEEDLKSLDPNIDMEKYKQLME